MSDRVRAGVALVVLGVWLLFMARQFVDPGFQFSEGGLGAMGAAAFMYLLGAGVVRSTRREDPNGA